jgi:serine/threonine protein kinase/tetratricopeptide (TPR) repeat protein/thiol-disulfide isomerase/thioredoxin
VTRRKQLFFQKNHFACQFFAGISHETGEEGVIPMESPSNSKTGELKSVFLGALEISDAEQRAAYLDEACGGNIELRSQVESLLKAHEQAGGFLKPVAFDPDVQPDQSPLAEAAGTVIGHYKLLEKIGEGGMAVVYMAEQQEPIRRKVALKIIKLGMDTKQVIARFEAERQALALMDHPNIAKVFDAGTTETGRPYFVMELVSGVSITEYCDKNNQSTKDRLALFLQVCNAVQHAHQKGIIHRDIKPSNVMVTMHDNKPVPKVIDFGIAKATNQRLTEKTLFTRYAQIIGTPAYMSPEQAGLSDLDIDTRTDIYSLGVLLYELLTGTTPFSEEELHQAGYLEMQRVIREQEPVKPSTRLSVLGDTATIVASRRGASPELLRKLLQGDLDWIVMKSLEKDRARRYETAQEVAADIVRHLSHEPVQAAAPSASYRLRKFVRRHRIGVLFGLLASVLVSLTICALAVSTVLVWQEQGRTQQALKREQNALDQETQARTAAEREAKTAQAVADFLNKDLLASVDPTRARGRQVTVREILDAACQKIEGRFQDEPLIEAAVRQTLGGTYGGLGEYAEAARQLERVYQIHREHLQEEDPLAIPAMASLGWVYVNQGRYDEAEPLLRRGLEIAERALGKEHATTLGRMSELAVLYDRQERSPEAESLYLQALESQKRVLGEGDLATLNTMHNLATLYSKQRRYQEAETLFRKVVETKQRSLGEDHPDTLRSVNNLATLLKQQGRYDEAEPLLLQTLEIMRRVFGEEHPDTLPTMQNLADLYRLQGRRQQSEPLFIKVLEIRRRTLGEEHPQTMDCMNGLAILYSEQGRYQEAEPLYLKLVEIAKRTLGEEQADTLGYMNNLAHVYFHQGRFPEAEPLQLKTVETLRRTLGDEHPDTINASKLLIALYDAWGKPDEAQSWRAKRPPDKVELPTLYVIPEENLRIPQDLQACAATLEKIDAALRKCQQDTGRWPDWLSDLVPTYLDENALFCPEDSAHKSNFSPDPKLACSYCWELSPALVAGNWDPTGRASNRDWKLEQTKVFGDIVPVVRCMHHGDNRVLSLSIGGKVFWGPLDWEYMFQKNYHFGDERFGRPSQPVAEGPALSHDTPNQPPPGPRLPERKQLVASGWKASWSPDDTRLVYGKPQRNGLQVLDLGSGKITDLTSSGAGPVWSPDGRLIAYTDRPNRDPNRTEEVWLVTSTGQSCRKLADGGYPTWSADGKTLFVQSRKENKVFSFDVNYPDAEPKVFFDGPQSRYPAVSPDGKRIAFGRRDELVIMDRETGRMVLVWPIPGRRGALAAWSPDGRQVAFGGFDNDPFGVWVLDVEAQEAVQVAEGRYTMPAWSNDGTKLAFDLRSDNVREIWVVQTEDIQGPKVNAARATQLSKSVLDPRVSRPGPAVLSPRETLLVGKPALAFTLKDLNGQQVSLSEFKGKVVLLDFWATWCPPCVKAIPHLESLYGKYKEEGLVVIGLNNEPDQAKVREFGKGRISYVVLLNANRPFAEYGIRAIPTLFYIDKEGTVRYQETGFEEGKEKEIETRVRELLGL